MRTDKLQIRRYAGIVTLLLLSHVVGTAGDYTITTVAGGALPVTPAPAAQALLNGPGALAVDKSGNVYFVDDNCVFKADVSGTVTRVAGASTRTGYAGDGGPAVNASLWFPMGLAVDAGGNLFIADTGNNVIRRVAPNGTITTVAGNGNAGNSGDGGQATSAELNYPQGVAVDANGNLFVADSYNGEIRRVAPDGRISTVAGSGWRDNSGDGGPATEAEIAPQYIAVDSAGNLYFSDATNVVRKVAVDGTISTVAGNSAKSYGYSGDGGQATSAQLAFPMGIAVDAAGNLYISDSSNQVVRRVSPAGIITTIAGGGKKFEDGIPATSANLGYTNSVAVDSTGNLYISDNSYRVRKIGADGNIGTVAGSTCCYSGDNVPATDVQLNRVTGLAVDNSGNLYVSDGFNSRVRKVAPDGTITTVAGTGDFGYSGDGGPGSKAQLNLPEGLAVDAAGNLYIADSLNAVIRKVTPDGIISTFAGTGKPGWTSGDGGLATAAALWNPLSVAVDGSGNVYIADEINSAIRKVGPDGIISTLTDLNSGTLTPTQVAVDSKGVVYVLGATGLINAAQPRNTLQVCDGGYCSVSAIATDAAGTLYVGLYGSTVDIRNATGGSLTRIAGFPANFGYSGDGGPALSARLGAVHALAADKSGNVYLGDWSVVRKLTPGISATPVLTVSKSYSGTITAGQTGASWSIVVSNAASSASTSGTVTVTENPPAELTITSMSGSGWSCTGSTCTRSDALAAGASYPAMTVLTDVSLSAKLNITNRVSVSGGGSATATASATDAVDGTLLPPLPASPANGATDVTLTPTLTWNAARGATSYEVWLGPASAMALAATVNGTSYTTAALNPSTLYDWRIVSRNGVEKLSSSVASFTTVAAPAISSDAYFLIDYPPAADQLVLRVQDPTVIAEARAIIAGKAGTLHLIGRVVKAPACYNPGWDYHIDSSSVSFADISVETCDASIAAVEKNLASVGGPFLPGNQWCPLGSRLLKEVSAPSCVSTMATNVSSATYSEVQFSPASLATAFGTNLATAKVPATDLNLPFLLGGTSVVVTDSAGQARTAALSYVSPQQVNYVVPPGTANGVAQVAVTNGSGAVSSGSIFVQGIAPALLTADASGKGLPAAWILRIKADGSSRYEPVAQWNATQTALVPAPIDLGAASDQVWLLLYGTGIRGRSKLSAVSAQASSVNLQVGYAGAQQQYEGLDQINLLLPHSLAGSGQSNVNVSVDGQPLNTVYVTFR
ncbi:MAG TPA: hypothetical protein VFA04_26395 [Bryobacteraceae bacterium]|nr:hypothetical protein [Bryobacteraceae bacterium]